MGKAGIALRSVLEKYQIPQNKLAVVMGISRSNIHRWVYEVGDPSGDNILAIRDALREISPEAANDFIRSYLGQLD
jgi:transcriptional regulator with XRE-family HTH domain